MAAAALEPVLAKLREMEMEHLFRDIEMPLVYTLRDMERAGISVEAEALKTYGDQLAGRIRELETAIYEQAGETFNINSPKQLGVILFEKCSFRRQEDEDRLFHSGRCAGKAGSGASDRGFHPGIPDTGKA